MGMKRAADLKNGTLVRAKVDGKELICLKAFRIGKEHHTNYLIPLDPLEKGRQGIALFYVDPEQPFKECGGSATLTVGEIDHDAPTHPAEQDSVEKVAVGQAFSNSTGTWLKVLDADSQLRPYAYVDLHTGELKHRQERTMSGFRDWSISAKRGFFGLFK